MPGGFSERFNAVTIQLPDLIFEVLFSFGILATQRGELDQCATANLRKTVNVSGL